MLKKPLAEHWLRHPPRQSLAPGLHAWLRDTGSLTARLRDRCDRLSVTVLHQRLARVQHDEAVLLGIPAGRCAWVREVLLVADGVPVVFARSVLPRASVRGGWRLFAAIGSRPLGEALFADPRIRRGPLAFARLDQRDVRHRTAVRVTGGDARESLWGRRSVFRRHGRTLLVTEIFLPTILELST